LNDKFIPFAQTWRGPHEKWLSDAWARFWKGWAADEKEVREGTVRVGSGWLLGTQFVTTTSAGRSLTGRVGGKGVAQGLKEILAAYAKLPETERRPKTVAGPNKPMPAPPPGGLVLTIYNRALGRDDEGRYRLPQGCDLGARHYRERGVTRTEGLATCAPAGQRSSLWLTATECNSLIPEDPRPGATHAVPARLARRIWLFGLLAECLWVVEGGWLPNSVRAGDLQVTVLEVNRESVRLRIHGSVLLVGKGGHLKVANRYDARLEGVLVYDRGKKAIARWDMAALGDWTGEWFTNRAGWQEARPDAPLRLGFSFALDRSDYETPERRRPRGFVHDYTFREREHYYWDPEQWQTDWEKSQRGQSRK
jgi:hypothetical protein